MSSRFHIREAALDGAGEPDFRPPPSTAVGRLAQPLGRVCAQHGHRATTVSLSVTKPAFGVLSSYGVRGKVAKDGG